MSGNHGYTGAAATAGSIGKALRPALPPGALVTVTARSKSRSRAIPAHIGRSGRVQRVLPSGDGWRVLVLLADCGSGTCREWYDAAELTFSGLTEAA